MIEFNSLYRAVDKETGLEIILIGSYVGPEGRLIHVGADMNGEGIEKYTHEITYNWRWNAQRRDWTDIDMPLGDG